MVNRFFEVQRKMKRKAEAEKQARKSIESMKKEQVTKRREFVSNDASCVVRSF